MERKKFLRKSIVGLGAIMGLPALTTGCQEPLDPSCPLTPTEGIGPFPNKTPAQLARENIISDRSGVAFLINLTIQDSNNGCVPLVGAAVDLWHCDAAGNYSQYGSQEDKDYLRGRQTTDANGQVSFISIFPGWYPGRAPHIHVEVIDSENKSLLGTQLAFPREVCDVVYATTGYQGTADTQNEGDGFFADGVEENLLDSLVGNVTDGYTMEKVINVRT
ncbi:MAG: intradiol ring-cleavage dioxygenase [Bacteroidota bacterium]